ncbi:DNA alkylation repair protein [Oleiharenicola lentus]|uniref:DNA alkylation repair protein n=1 Tax=Oleiharenicola lentus TaxID=2508720 RepID=UPI003F673924
MTAKEALAQLQKLGDEKLRAQNKKRGAGDNQFGVKHGDIRVLAKKIKTDHKLGLELWKTGNVEAQHLAALILDPKKLSTKELESLERTVSWSWVSDWLNNYIVDQHPEKESVREAWMNSYNVWLARAGWGLTGDRVADEPEGLDLSALLKRIEKEMKTSAPEVQWTMNSTLAKIGINHPEHRKRALAIGEKLGVYRDYPCSKGCTSPFAPIWINAMVKRQK